MNRRQLLTTVGIVVGTMVAVCGLYLTQLPAGDQSTRNSAPDRNASVTISQRQFEKLVDRISLSRGAGEVARERAGHPFAVD